MKKIKTTDGTIYCKSIENDEFKKFKQQFLTNYLQED